MATHTTITVQQPQASTYNYPRGDLLDGGRKRSEYLDIVVPLYRASIKGDLEAAKAILKGREYVVRYSITEKKDSPLHIAAAGHSTKLVSYFVNIMNEDDLQLRNEDGNTAFCVAAISGNVGMVEIMFKKNQALPTICGSENMMPLYLAAYHGNRDVVTFLYDKSGRMMGNEWTDVSRNGVLLKCIQSNIFDVAQQIMEDKEKLPDDKHLYWDVLQVLARKPRAFQLVKTQKLPFLELFHFLKMRFSKGRNATALLRVLLKRIMEKPKDFIDEILRGPMTVVEKSPGHEIETYPSQIIFIAAQMNNRRFLVELISEYPDVIWIKNDDGHTIFHIAVSHRHWETFSLLYEIGSMKDLVALIRDHQGNNLLHLAGKKPEQNDYEDLLTPLQIDSELIWFKEVEDTLPSPCREVKNVAGQTPQQLFIENHKEPNSDGAKWINDTVNVSMVVAALVCTISFAVVYSIPGGFDENTGFPMFLHKNTFIGYVVLDVISFISSSSSIILFLSVVLSRRHGNIEFLLKTWIAAQLLLMISVLFLVLSFCFSFFFIYGETAWTYLLYFVASQETAICITFCVALARKPYGRHRRPRNSMLYGKSSNA